MLLLHRCNVSGRSSEAQMSSVGQVNLQEWNTPPGRHLALQDAICGGEHSLKLTGELDVGSAPDLEAAIA